jgi:PmbA protein
MTENNISARCLELLRKYGAEKAQCVLNKTTTFQIRSEAGKMSLLRSVSNTELQLLAIKDNRQGQVSVNAAGKADMVDAALRAMEAAKASPQDKAYGISEPQPRQSFRKGDDKPDLEGMHSRLAEFLREARRYPGLCLAEALVGFTFENKVFSNSNSVDLSSSVGVYDLSLAFSSNAKKKSSSVNFVSRTFGDLSRPLMECGSIATLLKQSVESLGARPVSKKFAGDIIVSPECLGSFLQFITEQALRDARILAGTSPYMGRIGALVAGKNFTLQAMPLAPEIASGYFITPDGYKAENVSVVEKGRLNTFILSRYGAQKIGLDRTRNAGGGYIISPGPDKLGALVKSVKRGLLVTRFSGGAPNQKGDFSGVAKNSFYIENGKIVYPVAETMISGNIPEMFLRIKGISEERVNLGTAVYPWISFSGVTISGK